MTEKMKIYYVGGDKGGVGKSLVSISLIDYLLSNNQPVFLVETDTANPDVYKIYSSAVDSIAINLDEKIGWINLLNAVHGYSDRHVVINSAARSGDGIQQNVNMLTENLSELNRELITLWPINRQRDSVNLLKQYMDIVKSSRIVVLRNLYFGSESVFELFNQSKLKTTIESDKNNIVANFPDLADRVAEQIYTNRQTVSAALKNMPFGDRVELSRWKNAAAEIFKQI